MTLLTVFVGIIAVTNLVLMLAIAFLALSAKKLLDTSVKQAVREVQTTVHSVNEMVERVEDRTEKLLDISEQTARKVSGTVVATTDMVRDTITTPLIGVSGVLAGISRALKTWRRAPAG